MNQFQLALIAAAFAFALYTYVGYPFLLWVIANIRERTVSWQPSSAWPMVSVTVPAYNEKQEARNLIESLLRLNYPRERLQILIVSDASTDGTDEIVREYASRGIELLSLPTRMGKTAAEEAARSLLRGEIVVNTDASIRLHPDAVKALVAPFADPEIGVVSGRDVSIARQAAMTNGGEASYVGYEMKIRELETRVAGIVGASGCCYAIRRHLHSTDLPAGLSRDFASALIARRAGYRAVSAPDAVCYVPRTPQLRTEYRRKVRTITRGIETLAHLRTVLNPFRYGWFAIMLWNHKILRWLLPWVAAVTLVLLATQGNMASLVIGGAAATMVALALAGIFWPEGRRVPRGLSLPAFVLVGNVAAMHALVKAMMGERKAVWEPTRRAPQTALQ